MNRRNDSLLTFGCSSASFIAILLVWHWAAVGLNQQYLLPAPERVLRAAWEGLVNGSLIPHIRVTVLSTVAGVFGGCALGLLAAVVCFESRILRAALQPLVEGLQSVPKVAVAPLFVAYFGFDYTAKIVTVSVLCFFPMFVATLNGLGGADDDMVDLFRAYGANRMQILWRVRLPEASAAILTALQICVVLGFIACVVSEFVASRQGLGFLIKARSGELDVTTMFVAVILLTAISASLAALVRHLQARIVFWTGPRG